jgi:hypothetical protein
VSVLVKNKKLPLNLVKEAFNKTISKGEQLLQIETFAETFGPMRRRKRPAIGTSNLDELLAQANENEDNYDEAKD